MLRQRKFSLVPMLVLFLACAPQKPTSQPTHPETPNNPKPTEPVKGQSDALGGLNGSTWTGEGSSDDEPFLHAYVFKFSSDRLEIEVSCNMDMGKMKLTAGTAVAYSESGHVATLKAGIYSRTPAGAQTCSIVFPANLEFHLDGTAIFLVHNGTRQNTQFKKLK